MEYARYVELAHRAAAYVAADQHEQALALFRKLIASDIADLDKASMYCNMALVQETMGREQDALDSYDHGIELEWLHARSMAAERKAAYLAQLGRTQECLLLYEELWNRLSLTEEEKHRIGHNIGVLRETLVKVSRHPDSGVRQQTHHMSIPQGWLQCKTSVAHVEAGFAQEQPVDQWMAEWRRFINSMQPSDELWEYSSPTESWEQLAGRAGYAIVRQGTVVNAILTEMN